MGELIMFPKTERARQFYKFLVRWDDGVTFSGDTIEECFRKQKDVFEPEISMNEYIDRFITRIENVTNTYYSIHTIAQLADVLTELGYLIVEKSGSPWSNKNG